MMRTVSHYVTMYWLFDRFHGAGLGAAAVPQALGQLNNNILVVLPSIFSNTLSNSRLRIAHHSSQINVLIQFTSLLLHLPSAQ